jgi:hypothetical protein
VIPETDSRWPREVFLSHSAKDRRFVEKLVRSLGRDGLKFWYSKSHLKASQQWHDEIGRALKRCDWFLIVLSKASVRSMWVRRELLYVLRQKRLRDRIVPVLYQQCNLEELSWTLPDFQIVDFRQGFDEGYMSLLRIWK